MVAGIHDLVPEALAFLDAGLDYAAFSSSGAWHLEGLEFGRDPSRPAEVFEIVLTTGEYGDWYSCHLAWSAGDPA